MTNTEIAKLLRSAASAMLHGRRSTAQHKVSLASEALSPMFTAGSEDERYPDYRARVLGETTNTPPYEDFPEPTDRLEAILADARHYAQKHNIDFHAANRAAYSLFLRDVTL